ncbi:ABC-type nitrate/sulfonate/bicarbonate transport system substrate-binding protein [Anaerobacterium chartisolvens]|uniref:ABC-type nitrate/sulfonate/bicarbonate transport system substrate-binding protein n=1 Tax=Anaerobacterium chartisolvens TaxID=1297424 RepID=A0A369AK13_9FIRM|nr:ABC transporter substrate-binding protein [Anaerobacterium chartisolvens]RCX08487.1 ABC-type nitrate/sulfonate/bicarbonate transport system substrate-binding protein [Anaerobacterium chartisolvens]
MNIGKTNKYAAAAVAAAGILILAVLAGVLFSNPETLKGIFNGALAQQDTVKENEGLKIDTARYTKAESGEYDVVFALDSWIGSTPAIYALDKQLDKKYSLKVGIETLWDEKTKMLGLKEGKFQAVELALPVFLDMQREYPGCGVIAAVTDLSYGSDGIISKPEIEELSEIKGKKVAYLSDGISKYSLGQFLSKANLKFKDIEPVEKASFEDMMEGISNGDIDAVVASDQLLFTVLNHVNNEGTDYMKLLLSSRDIADFMPTVLVISNDFAQEKPDKAKDFLKMWFDSVDGIIKNTDKSFLDILEASRKYPEVYGEVTEDDAKQSLAGIKLVSMNENLDYFGISAWDASARDAKLADIIEDTQGFIQSSEDASQEIDASKLISGAFVEAIFKETEKALGSEAE